LKLLIDRTLLRDIAVGQNFLVEARRDGMGKIRLFSGKERTFGSGGLSMRGRSLHDALNESGSGAGNVCNVVEEAQVFASRSLW
jgi:hypothetical protein